MICHQFFSKLLWTPLMNIDPKLARFIWFLLDLHRINMVEAFLFVKIQKNEIKRIYAKKNRAA